MKIDAKLAFLFSGSMYALLTFPIFLLMKPVNSTKTTEDVNSTKLDLTQLIFIVLATICSWATLGQFTSYIG
ncbi:hypothetical protein, partial [Bacillus paralicheniformis]